VQRAITEYGAIIMPHSCGIIFSRSAFPTYPIPPSKSDPNRDTLNAGSLLRRPGIAVLGRDPDRSLDGSSIGDDRQTGAVERDLPG
jgi:hypothetical protein